VLLYIERWLKAPVMMEDGSLVPRDQGTPQGGVISPLLANLFLHYVFDVWLTRAMPGDTVRTVCRRQCATTARRGGSDVTQPNRSSLLHER
jgi:retron-type reverse transcriptase